MSPHRSNRLLASLPARSIGRLRPDLEAVWMPLGQVVHQPHVPFEHVYFPVTCVVTLRSVLTDGAAGTVGMIGREGMVGTALLFGGDHAVYQALVHVAGEAVRLKFAALNAECERSPALRNALLRHQHVLLIQAAQGVVCARFHTLDQQVCLWLLLTLDRVRSSQLDLTHERMATMLGVRRVGITLAAGRLKAAGLIDYHRGTITVLDRKGLEERACECYATIGRNTASLAP